MPKARRQRTRRTRSNRPPTPWPLPSALLLLLALFQNFHDFLLLFRQRPPATIPYILSDRP
ncbi:hypothetical protein STLV2gp06 [Simian T-lymphotropic virus 2]|uniref:Uncharacterized protein n=1 Tax=Simian T-lymphotropic virus 2 TaxID=33748 RepID=O70645_9DELA|nr:hypothetical protein STLV2gp06 [Simian T-lymphotropic virus 2]CAA74905.1 hypothetical protein [Simian T-lymphotropic virus 2]